MVLPTIPTVPPVAPPTPVTVSGLPSTSVSLSRRSSTSMSIAVSSSVVNPLSGLAIGATYALIGVAYNIMFATSRVMSFTTGHLGMLGGVFGSLLILRLGIPIIPGLLITLALCALSTAATAQRSATWRPTLKPRWGRRR